MNIACNTHVELKLSSQTHKYDIPSKFECHTSLVEGKCQAINLIISSINNNN